MKRKATITVLLVTAVYIVFNLPVFINFILYIITLARGTYPAPYYTSIVMSHYSWNFTYVLCVVMNSTTNPIIYFFRMKKYKRAVIGTFKRRKRVMVLEVKQRISRISQAAPINIDELDNEVTA